MREIPKFRILKRGYDRFEVDTELTKIYGQLERVEQRNEAYVHQLETVNQKVGLLKERYQQLLQEMVIKEKAADKISQLALKEASSIINSANDNADSIVREALNMAQDILLEISRISRESMNLKGELTQKTTELQSVIDSLDIPPVWSFNNKSKDEEQDKPEVSGS